VRAGGDLLTEAARIADRQRLAVEGDVDVHGAEEPAASAAAQAELVLGVEREVVGDQQAAAGTERQPFDVLVLGQPAGRRIGDLGGSGAAIAHGLAADLHRRAHVALDQRRRHRERLGDVVEAFVGVVGRQERLHVHVERQQIADRIGVLGAVETMERGRVGVRTRRVGAIEPRLERRGKAVERGAIRARHAARRHHPRLDLAHHLFPHFGVGADVIEPAGSSTSPPTFVRSLWHVRQYCLTKLGSATGSAAVVCGRTAATARGTGAPDCAETTAKAATQTTAKGRTLICRVP
jgi:hypothetical protein